jgi:trk system potassium uptake protein TrkA
MSGHYCADEGAGMIKKRFAVIGMGRFGFSVATALFKMGAEVLAIDTDRELINNIQDRVTHAVALDATKKALLQDQGVDRVDCAVVGIGENFEATVLITSLLNEFGIPEVITRSYNDLQKEILKKIGATQIVSPEEDMGARMAKNLFTGAIVDFLELPEGFTVNMVETPRNLAGKTLAEARIRTQFKDIVVTIQKPAVDEKTNEAGMAVIALPGGEEVLNKGDILGVIGREEDIEKFR